MFKKSFFRSFVLLTTIASLSITSSAAEYKVQPEVGPGVKLEQKLSDEINPREQIGSYVYSLYQYKDENPYDKIAIEALDNYKEIMTTNPDKIIFEGNLDELASFYDNYMMKFGLIKEMGLRITSINKDTIFRLRFRKAERNIDNIIEDYLNEAERYKEVANSCKKEKVEDTINESYNYLYNNIINFSLIRLPGESNKDHIFSALSGVPQVCRGFSYALNRLLFINNIKCGSSQGYYDGELHQWSYAYTDDNNYKWYDISLNRIYEADQLPNNYSFIKSTIYLLSSN